MNLQDTVGEQDRVGQCRPVAQGRGEIGGRVKGNARLFAGGDGASIGIAQGELEPVGRGQEAVAQLHRRHAYRDGVISHHRQVIARVGQVQIEC